MIFTKERMGAKGLSNWVKEAVRKRDSLKRV